MYVSFVSPSRWLCSVDSPTYFRRSSSNVSLPFIRFQHSFWSKWAVIPPSPQWRLRWVSYLLCTCLRFVLVLSIICHVFTLRLPALLKLNIWYCNMPSSSFTQDGEELRITLSWIVDPSGTRCCSVSRMHVWRPATMVQWYRLQYYLVKNTFLNAHLRYSRSVANMLQSGTRMRRHSEF